MTRSSSPVPTAAEKPESAEITLAVLLLPFILVVLALVLTGRRSPSELALTSPFLVVPLAIGMLRSRAHHAHRT